MRSRSTAWLLFGLLPLALSARAQGTADDGDAVKEEDVATWVITVEEDGKEQKYEARPAAFTYTGDTGLFRLSSAYTLTKGRGGFSLFRDNYDRDPKDLDFSIHGLSLAYGVTSRVELFASAGLQNRLDVDAAFQPGFANDLPFAGATANSPGWATGFGDIRAGLKVNFLDDYAGDAVGLALRGTVKLGTADETEGLGTGKPSFGADLILSKTLNKKADIHASIGYQVNSDPDDRNIGNALKWGVGLNLPACKMFQVHAEVVGTQYGDADFDQTNPVDVVVGPAVWFGGFYIRPALSWNLAFDDRGLNSSSKTYTGRHIAIGYHPGTKCHPIAAPTPPPIANRPPTVSCDADRSTIAPGESVRCRATGSDPDGDTLTYTWTSTAGRVTGTGSEVSFDSTGVPAGTTVTVTVRVSDGKGGTAESRCSILIQSKAAEPIVCTSGGFPANLARLNNVDKACLDDVASRLKQDPRSRVVVVGHADSRERYPEVIGRRRAEAVKNYLVNERGIEESRVSVRSAAATQPKDSGTSVQARASNRRVEIYFLPEGARMPGE
jgi:outer membrane protein OmpA-like peptidoglycan-associated protein